MWWRFTRWLEDFPERHPDLPMWISLIALIASIAMPLLRKFLEGML